MPPLTFQLPRTFLKTITKPIRNAFRGGLFVAFCFLLGCTSPQIGPLTPPPSQTMPFYVDSRTLSFESNLTGPTRNEDLNFLLERYETWAHNQFLAKGPQGKAVLTLETLTVKETPNTQNSPSSLSAPSQMRLLTAHICVKLLVSSEDSRLHKERFFEGRATASHSFSAKTTLLEREKILDSLANQLIGALSRQFGAQSL